jgi:N-acetylneuraminic acid mutarotase
MIMLRMFLPVFIAALLCPGRCDPSDGSLTWSELPRLPDRQGFGGPYAGSHNGALLVGGGANFPDKPPWEDGRKVWYDSVFVLDKPDGAWKPAGRLPRATGYGVSLSTEDGIACIGGSDADRHYADAWKASGEMPAAQVTTTIVRWRGGYVMPSGEIRPGVRSPAVFLLRTPD